MLVSHFDSSPTLYRNYPGNTNWGLLHCILVRGDPAGQNVTRDRHKTEYLAICFVVIERSLEFGSCISVNHILVKLLHRTVQL